MSEYKVYWLTDFPLINSWAWLERRKKAVRTSLKQLYTCRYSTGHLIQSCQDELGWD